jgi:hypothetical protein
MNQGIDLTTEQDIDAAMERARMVPDRPVAISATYNTALDIVILQLNNGRRLVIPREMLQGLTSATAEQLSDIEIHCGVDIAWPQLDVDHYLPYLIEGSYGSDKWMKSLKESLVAA